MQWLQTRSTDTFVLVDYSYNVSKNIRQENIDTGFLNKSRGIKTFDRKWPERRLSLFTKQDANRSYLDLDY